MPRSVVRVVLFTIILLVFLQPSALARDKKADRLIPCVPWEPYMYELPDDEGVEPVLLSAAVDTYYLACYDFEMLSWQGWSQKDMTAQEDIFFHVDDFAGLGGGDWGLLLPLEGTKSMWCGVRPGSGFYLCGWATAPGYGNNWDQRLQSERFGLAGPVTVSYRGSFDSEPDFDRTTFEYFDSNDGGWVELDSWECISWQFGVADTIVEHTLNLAQASTKLRFRFTSDGLWSDEDGKWSSDGACVIDSITIKCAAGLIDYEDFESSQLGDRHAGIWTAHAGPSFGMYSGLMSGLDFCAEDPCGTNHSTQIVFFEGSEDPYPPCPGLFMTPFCREDEEGDRMCQEEIVYSPIIDLTKYSTGFDDNQDADIPPGDLGTLGGLILRFTAYTDLPEENNTYYSIYVREVRDGCPGPWEGLYLYYGSFKEYITRNIDLNEYLGSQHSDSIQVAFIILHRDYYGYDETEHTTSPWFDNVKVLRCSTLGPQWSYYDKNLFQDKFPSSGEMEGFVRADMADDTSPNNRPGIFPGDSVVVKCTSPTAGGLATLATGEERVYMHCRASYIGDGTPKPDLAGPQLEGDYGSYVSDDGEWTVFLCDNTAEDYYACDLNDKLFTRGYLIEYYFKAYDLDGLSTTLPAGAESAGEPEPNGTELLFEFTCLPTISEYPGLLYVDDYHGRGTLRGVVDVYMDMAFYNCPVRRDRYDVNAPTMKVSNGIGAYVSADNAASIFCQAYEMVFFDSGDLDAMTISYGDVESSDKSNDAKLLNDWMENSNHNVLLWVLGDGVASDLAGSGSAEAIELMSTRCGVELGSSSYFELSGGLSGGGVPSPLVTGMEDTPFWGTKYYAAGGCPILKDFDVLEPAGIGQPCLQYQDYGGSPAYAGIFTDEYISPIKRIRTVWTGHSMMSVRGVGGQGQARNWLASDVFGFFGYATFWLTDSGIPAVSSLSKNFPNPFNPVTRLEYALASKGHVSIRIYDVSGRLVRVLVDDVKDAGRYEAVWDGRSDLGHQAASGIYFCRMQAGDFEQSRKMVMLR